MIGRAAAVITRAAAAGARWSPFAARAPLLLAFRLCGPGPVVG